MLTAWSRHNPEVGYCQGLNSVAATLLLLMSEENAFWSLAQILETRIPAGFFGVTLWRCHAEIEVLKALLSCREPRALGILNAGGLPLEMFASQWFMTLFVSDLPLETAMRLWDVLIFAQTRPATEAANASDGSCTGDGCAVLLAGCLAAITLIMPQLELAPDPGRRAISLISSQPAHPV